MDSNNALEEIFSFDAIEQSDENEENEECSIGENIPKAEIWAEKIGAAPTDYLIVVQTSVISAPEAMPTYVLVWCEPESLEYYVSKYPVIKDKEILPQEERGEPSEAYKQVVQAKESKYFNEIFIIDRILDRKIAEIKEHERDTKYTPHRLRTINVWGQYIDLYAEQYIEETPERQEYLQVHSRNGRYLYTASHESYARLHELGYMYEGYFGKPPKENYFIKYLSYKDFPEKYYKYVLPIKKLQHIAMEQKLEIGLKLPEFADKPFRISPIITSIRGGPSESATGALTEATIDVNPAVRIYAIIVHIENVTDSDPDLIMLSKHSQYNDNIKHKYRAFDFEWKTVIIKAYESRESAFSDDIYGDLFKCLSILNDDITKSKTPYCWRKGMDDMYGFSKIVLNGFVGKEMYKYNELSLDNNYQKKPKNLRLMAEPHPSTAVIFDNYETVPLVP